MSDSKAVFRDLLEQFHQLKNTLAQQQEMSSALWLAYLDLVQQLCRVKGVALLHIHASQQAELVVEKPFTAEQSFVPLIATPEFQSVLMKANESGFFVRRPSPNRLSDQSLYLAIKLISPKPYVLLIALEPQDHTRVNDVLVRAQLLSDLWLDIPAYQDNAYPSTPSARLTAGQSEVVSLLPLLVDLFHAEHFGSATLTFVNGLVSQIDTLDQVVIAWHEGEYMRVKAISHYESFEKRSDTIKFFEAAIEESADQSQLIALIDGEVQNKDGHLISLANEQLRNHLNCKTLVTIPLLDQHNHVVLGVSLVSYKQPIDQSVLTAVHFLGQIMLPQLQRLADADKGPWVRAGDYFAQRVKKLLGRDNWAMKLAIVTLTVAFNLSLIVNDMHRVDAAGQLVTDHTRLISAPMDGVVNQVYHTSGDLVNQGDVLFEIDTRELILQLAETQAELQRNLAELNKARADFDSVQMEVATARVAQVKAKIDLLNYRLALTRGLSPLAGIIVEGDSRDIISAPVKQGQVLFKIAQIEELYLKLDVKSEDVHFLTNAKTGSFAFLSQPDVKMPITIQKIIPMASVKDQEGAKFSVIAVIDVPAQEWWRPGMTGAAKIDINERPLFWIMTHKLWEKIQMMFWW